MGPPGLRAPGLLVTVTGILELAGAAALMLPRASRRAAIGLGALLVALFPANVHAATHRRELAWSDQLGSRTVRQVVFLRALTAVARGGRPADLRPGAHGLEGP